MRGIIEITLMWTAPDGNKMETKSLQRVVPVSYSAHWTACNGMNVIQTLSTVSGNDSGYIYIPDC